SDVLVSPGQGVEDRGRPGQAEPGGLVPNPSGGVRGGARNLQVEPQDGERHTPGEGCQDEPARLHAEQRGGGGERAESRRAHALKSQQKSGGNCYVEAECEGNGIDPHGKPDACSKLGESLLERAALRQPDGQHRHDGGPGGGGRDGPGGSLAQPSKGSG